LTVEVSAEGATWSSGPMAVTTLSESVQGGIRTVRVRDLAPSDGASPARRIRLKIQKQLSL
jgi:hypothetical protein